MSSHTTIEHMNKAFGSMNWRAEDEERETKDGKTTDGKYWIFARVICTVELWDGAQWIAQKR